MTEIRMKEIENILVETFLFSDVSPLTVEKQTPFFSECAFISYSVDTIIQSAEAPITGIALIAEFASDICRDCGETALARRIDTGTKIAVAAAALPTAVQLMEGLSSLFE